MSEYSEDAVAMNTVTIERLRELDARMNGTDDADVAFNVAKELHLASIAYVRQLLSTPPAGDAGAVAPVAAKIVWHDPAIGMDISMVNEGVPTAVVGQNNCKSVTPLYTHPPAAAPGDSGASDVVREMIRVCAATSEHGSIDAAIVRDWAARIGATPAGDSGVMEVRADGVEARKDRWETGFRSIVSILVGPRTEFEIPDIVQRVRDLAPTGDSVRVPRGWRLVPEFPTPEMIGAAWKTATVRDPLSPTPVYTAMLAAAPQQAEGGWPSDVAFIAEVMRDWTTLQLPGGKSFAFNRETGKVYKLPHPDAPFVQIPRLPLPPGEGVR